MTSQPSYLSALNSLPGLRADFIARIPDIPVDTDKWKTIARLKPEHDRKILELGFSPDQIWLAEQIHGADVVLVPPLAGSPPSLIPGADGLICSGESSCLLGIYVADCAAIWLYDQASGAMGLLHSGKKGTEGEISLRALELMKNQFKTNPRNVIAVISPCIRPPHYEVDIAAMIREQLLHAGIPPENLTDSCLNTAADTTSFYSYRIEKGSTGRMLALFGRK